MAGAIALSAEKHWSASSWLFEWVIRSLARQLEDERLARFLSEIADENLGSLDISTLSASDRRAVTESIHALPAIAERESCRGRYRNAKRRSITSVL